MTYETHYCAYVDILGFRELIRELDAAPPDIQSKKADEIEKLFVEMQMPFPEVRPTKAKHLKVQTISDAICVTAPATPEALVELLSTLSGLLVNLLRYGYFVRGAVVKGRLHHDQNFVFGGALVRAYELESTVVRYPRIMLTREVAEDAHEGRNVDGAHPDMLRAADDGPMFLHALGWPMMYLEGGVTGGSQAIIASHFRNIAGQIQRRFNESVDNPRHFEKVQWFAKYWNASTTRVRHLIPKIEGPGLGPFGIE